MTTVRTRTMTPAEYETWARLLGVAYAEEQVAAGRWPREGALQRALDENARQLPQGAETAGMLVLQGLDRAGAPVGHAWVALDPPHTTAGIAFLNDIEVRPERRGQGWGRALLAAVEEATREVGATALELNVFGRNEAAIRLYANAGYDVVTQQMRKPL
ncbi:MULTISPECIES: GNAT family N-acetyltransferase [Bacteria]|uniref:GNAT family N-acetyltransferase n=1 Tax=Bacteria TaxID=2 RepID=UPI003C7BA2A9